MINQARLAMADFLNAPSLQEFIFGANMTTLTYNLSHSIGRSLQLDDEIIITRLDHDANSSPWLALEEQGARLKWADFDVDRLLIALREL